MQPDTDGATNIIAEEPPSKNVRAARRGVAVGLISVVVGLVLIVWAGAHDWAYPVGLIVSTAAMLVLIAMTGLGVAFFGYGTERSARSAVAADNALLVKFEAALDKRMAELGETLTAMEVDRVRRDHRLMDRLTKTWVEELGEVMARERTILRMRTQDAPRPVAEVPRQQRARHRGRRGRQVSGSGEPLPDNVRQLRSVPGGMDALKRIAKKIIDDPDQ